MKKGTVYFHQNYLFPDGETSDKLFIILNTPREDEFFITCKTTSQQKDRSENEGCHHVDNFYVLRENYDFFSQKTWVQFHVYYPVSQIRLFDLQKRGIIAKKAELRDQTIKAIINCIGKTEDIQGLYWSMINR